MPKLCFILLKSTPRTDFCLQPAGESLLESPKGWDIIYLYQMSVVKLLVEQATVSALACTSIRSHTLLSSLPVIRERSFSAHQSDAAGVGDVLPA
jgi:hypothetical protein